MFNKKISTVMVIFAVVLVMSVCFRLSYWQWQRAFEKQAQLAMLSEHRENQRLLMNTNTELLQGAKTELVGQLVPDYWWLLDNQILNGQIGYDLIALFNADGVDEHFIINLGFVAAGADRSQLPIIELPLEPIEVKAQFKIGEWSGFTLAKYPNQSAHHRNVLQYLEWSFFSRELSVAVSPLLVIANRTVVTGVTPHYKAVVMSPDKHRAYALQWFLIGLSAGIIAFFATRPKSKELIR
ncbi:SURF1 family protein [Pseudoalteromonas luteoviolacea]|uniref:SURF1 family protein n=1 Tax=Pseudoalteromonas luteoviolacea TaxID=43657 RepID=UPI0011AB38FC|nr:SURF1 family protein [Pseudoalteromonas luteoviolacea]